MLLTIARMSVLLTSLRGVAGRLGLRLVEPGDLDRSGTVEVWERAVCQDVAVAAHVLPWATCLAQALVAQRLLGRRGVESAVVFGMAREADGWLNHAWLARGDEVLLGDLPGVQLVTTGVLVRAHPQIVA